MNMNSCVRCGKAIDKKAPLSLCKECINHISNGYMNGKPQVVKNKWYPHADMPDPDYIPDGQLFVVYNRRHAFVCRYDSRLKRFYEIHEFRSDVFMPLSFAKWWMMIDDLPEAPL